MAYLFYTISFILLACATSKSAYQILGTSNSDGLAHLVLYATRNTWKPHAPPIPYITAPGTIPDWAYNLYDRTAAYIDRWRYSSLPSSFQDDAEQGLHSSHFDLAQNIEAEDSRAGLDGDAKAEIYGLMRRHGVDFDEARRLWVERKFAAAGVGSDGRPLDRKAVVFS
jgi:hypothetical protein